MRRMKDMASMQPGAGMYGAFPDSYELVVNVDQAAVKHIVDVATEVLSPVLKPIHEEMQALEAKIAEVRKAAEEKKEKADVKDDEQKMAELRAKGEKAVSDYAAGVGEVRQIIDLALLQSNMLKGEELTEFIKRNYAALKA